ncbi:MAG: hypothetical protein H6740_04055 [Alphaproteobacteria bacterium]|nr:hypothetical protein [Alphaproteobacteria bacterium]
MRLLPLLALLGCTPSGTIKLGDSGTPGGDDTGTTGDDTGAGGDDSGEDTEPPPEPDFSRWIGERSVLYDDCEEIIYEEGQAYEADWEYYDVVFEWCPECDYVYSVEAGPEQVCGLGVTQQTYRLLDLDGDRAILYYFDQREGWLELAEGDFDGFNIEYRYRLYDGAVDIEGRVEFPEL